MTTRKGRARRSCTKRKEAPICEDAPYIRNSRILVGREWIEVALVGTISALEDEATAPSSPAFKLIQKVPVFPSPLLSPAPSRLQIATMATLESRVDKVIQEQVDDGIPILHQIIQRKQQRRVTFHESVLEREHERLSPELSWDEDGTTPDQLEIYPSLVDATSTLFEPSPRNVALSKHLVGDRVDRIIGNLANENHAEPFDDTRQELSRVEFLYPSRATNTEDVISDPLPINDLNVVSHDQSLLALRFVQEVGAFDQSHRSFSQANGFSKKCEEQPWRLANSLRQEDESGSSLTEPQLGSTDRHEKQTGHSDCLTKLQLDESGSVFPFVEAPEPSKSEEFRVAEPWFGLSTDVFHTASLKQDRRGGEIHAHAMGSLSKKQCALEEMKTLSGHLFSRLSFYGCAIPSKGCGVDADGEAHPLEGNGPAASRIGEDSSNIPLRSEKGLWRESELRNNLSNDTPVQTSGQTSAQQLFSIFGIDSVGPMPEVSGYSSSPAATKPQLDSSGDVLLAIERGSPKSQGTSSLDAQSASSVASKASEPTWSIDGPPENKDKLQEVPDVRSESPTKCPTDSKASRSIGDKQSEKPDIPTKDSVTTETTASMSSLLSQDTSFHVDSDLDQQLFNAAEAGDFREVQRIQQEGGNILSNRGPTKETALIAACRCGHFFTVQVLLDSGADLEKGDCDDARPLDWASGAGHVDIVRLLLSKGADLGARADGSTPLHWATAGAHPKVIKMLLDAGVNFSSSVIGELPVLCTLEEEELDLARFIALTCNEKCCSDGKGKEDPSLLRMACALARYVEVAKQLSYQGSSAFVGNEDSGVTSLDIAYIDCGLVLLDYLLQRYEENVLKPGHDQHTLARSDEYRLLRSLRASFRNTRTDAHPKSTCGPADARAFSPLNCIDFRYALCLPDETSIVERHCEDVQRDGGSVDDASKIDRLVLEQLCDSSSKMHWYSTFPSCT